MNAPCSGFPFNLTLEALGDCWSLIVIRDLMFGSRGHFRELLTRSVGADSLVRCNLHDRQHGRRRALDWSWTSPNF